MISLNSGWEFAREWSEEFLRGEGSFEEVRLPHTNLVLPYHNIDSESYQMVCGYRKNVEAPVPMERKRAFLKFDGAAHIATVYVNGKEKTVHRCGYTAFLVEITEELRMGPAKVAVRLDTTENPSVPPFGYVVDYLTYGGLYRPVWLQITDETYISDIFVYTPDLETAKVSIKAEGEEDRSKCERTVSILSLDGEELCKASSFGDEFELKLKGAKPWSVDEPNLYILRAEIEGGSSKETFFGFRTAVFKTDGFYLNGKKLFIRGLNRHQSYPYIGYAATDSLQKEDARILKEELACNAVRTSHYPQSQSFIDECDRIGLLVFTEIPGWQHIGDSEWKKQAMENTKEMVLQYRNHPSIVLWGVRINESQDDDDFYRETNRIARELDPSRQTSGVRYLEKSSCLEDVYAYNDFSHTGKNPGAKKKKSVVADMSTPLLISECNGHMFPTKSFDKWQVRQDHALRHARVLNDAIADGEHVGVFEWCMFDYPTHKDFGSGDRICYHGVLDGFRNPKIAAAVWSSQGDDVPVLEVSSSMDIGDYPAGQIGDVYVFSNADSVDLYKNGQYVTQLKTKPYAFLPHSPLCVDDYIGELLKVNEGFEGGKEKIIHECLAAAKRYGINDLPLKYKLKLAWAMLRYGMKYSDGVELYGKYVGDWGGSATVWRFEGKKDGKVVSVRELSPNVSLHLDVKVSKTDLTEGDTYDMAMVRVRILNAYGNVQSYSQLPVTFETSGSIELAGPRVSTAEGGMTGCFIKTIGKEGEGTLRISCEGCETLEIGFDVKRALF